MASSLRAEFITNNRKLFPLKSIDDVIHLFRQHLEGHVEPDLTLLSIVTGIIENTLTSKCAVVPAAPPSSSSSSSATLSQQSSSTTTTTTTTTTPVSNTGTAAVAAATAAGSQQTQHVSSESPSTAATGSNFPVVHLDQVHELYNKFRNVLANVDNGHVGTKASKQPAKTLYASREIIKKVSDVIWNSLIRTTYKDRAHLQSLYSYLAGNKLDCFGVAMAVVAGCQLLGYADVHLAISEDHAWVVFGKSGTDTVEVTWHGKGTEDKRGQPVNTGYESHSWLYLSGNPVICDRYMEVAAVVSSINPSLNMTSACLEVADLQQRLLWLLYDSRHLHKYPMALGCLGELEEVAPTSNRPSCEDLYAEAVIAAKTNYKNHHVYPYTYQGGYYYRQNLYKDAFSSWANAGDVIRLYNYSRDDEEIYKEFLDIANEQIPLIMKTESSGHSAKSVLRDPQCFANLLRFYDGICQWEEGSQTPILHIGWAKPLVTTIARFDCDIRSQVIINIGRDDEDICRYMLHLNERNNNNDLISEPVASVKSVDDKSLKEAVIPTLEALTAACGEKILNPDFLLQGGGKPFADQQDNDQSTTTTIITDTTETTTTTDEPNNKELSSESTNDKKKQCILVAGTQETKVGTETTTTTTTPLITESQQSSPKTPIYDENINICIPKRPIITLYSRKMKGIKDLLLAEKLNTHAISLQVTAQSQVQVGGKKNRTAAMSSNSVSYAKRSRRQ